MDIPKLQHRAAQTSQLSTCVTFKLSHVRTIRRVTYTASLNPQQPKTTDRNFQRLAPACLQSFLDTYCTSRSPTKIPPGWGQGVAIACSRRCGIPLKPPHLSAGVAANSIYPTLVSPYPTHVDEQCKVTVWRRQTRVCNHEPARKGRQYVTLKAACTSGSCRSKQPSNNSYQRVICGIVRHRVKCFHDTLA